MSLFDQILSAIDNPEQEGSPNQVGDILNVVQQLSSNYQTSPETMTSALSVVGNYVRGALQEKRTTEGEGSVNQIINQFAGTTPSNQVIDILFSNAQIQQILREVSSRTGLNEQLIRMALPYLVPLVLNFLKTGNLSNNPLGSNPVLTSFLDSDRDGDVDIADAIAMASRHFGLR